MNLESRARRAAASLKASVAGLAAPARGAGPASSRRRLVGSLAVGGALAAALLVVAMLVFPSSGDQVPVAGADLSPTTTTTTVVAANLDGTTTLPDPGEPGAGPSGHYPDQGGPLGPTWVPPTTVPGDGQNGPNPAGPGEGGSEGDHADLLPGFWASQAYGCSAEEEPVELFYGGGEPGETIALDSPYGTATVVVDEDGYWEASLAFAGAAYDEPFAVTAASSAGEAWELTFVVTDPANGECAPPVDYWFSASQLSGCSIAEPPSDQFYGSGLPGDTIVLDSPYGGGTAVVDESGWWEITLTFEGAPIGEIFTVTATSGAGEVAEMSFTAADPENGECAPPLEYWFSAYQGSGCSVEAPPADYFYGTGFPGDIIAITSPYGSASAVVDEWGWWETSLTFAGAPYDEPFDIDVTAPDGEAWTFSFTAPDPATGSCWLFTAYQGAACSTEQPPSGYFWGSGTPGDVVKLTSPHASAEALVDEWGFWEATLTFAGAPVGEAFTIEVAAPDGTIWAFPFIVGDPAQGTCGGTVEPCTPSGDCDGGPAPWPLPGDQSPADVQSVGFLLAESHPVQVSVVVAGFLPTPCHHLAWDLSGGGDDAHPRPLLAGRPDGGLRPGPDPIHRSHRPRRVRPGVVRAGGERGRVPLRGLKGDSPDGRAAACGWGARPGRERAAPVGAARYRGTVGTGQSSPPGPPWPWP